MAVLPSLEVLTVAAHQRPQRDLSLRQEARWQMFRTVHTLVDRAGEHGAVRADVAGTAVILLMCAPIYVISYVPDAAPDLWRRYLAISVDGRRRQGAHLLPQPAPVTP